MRYNWSMPTLWNNLRFWDYYYYSELHGAISGRPWLNAFYLFFAKYGIVLIVLSLIYLIWKLTINAFICSFIAMAISTFLAFSVIIFWQRQRPFVSHSDVFAKPITDGLYVSSVSFPSAHTYMSFALATSVFLYGHRRLGTALFVLATLVAVGRVGAGLHYPSDAVAGALVGIVSGILAKRVVEHSQAKWE